MDRRWRSVPAVEDRRLSAGMGGQPATAEYRSRQISGQADVNTDWFNPLTPLVPALPGEDYLILRRISPERIPQEATRMGNCGSGMIA